MIVHENFYGSLPTFIQLPQIKKLPYSNYLRPKLVGRDQPSGTGVDRRFNFIVIGTLGIRAVLLDELSLDGSAFTDIAFC